MKRIILGALLLITLLLAISCNENESVLFETKEVDYLNDVKKSLKGELLKISPMGLDDIIVCDSLLLATVQDPQGQFKVYSLKTGKEIASLCSQGRAANEFLNAITLCKQRYIRDGHLIVPLVDNYDIIKEVDVTQSIEQKKTVVVSSTSAIHVANGSSVILNKNPKQRFEITDAGYDEKESDKLTPMKYEITDQDSSLVTINMFKNMMEAEEENYDVLNAYMNWATMHPSKNYVVQLFRWMDYILFFDIDNKDYFAIHQTGTPSFADKAKHINHEDKPRFGDVAFYDDGFFVLYEAGSNHYNDKGTQCPNLLQFDLKGNYIQGFNLEQTIHRIEYDKERKRIIGAYITEELLYSFDLSEYI